MADVDARLRESGHASLMAYGRKSAGQGTAYKFCTELEAALQKVLNKAGLTMMYGGNYASTARLISYIRRNRPDVVHLHCINGYCVNIYRLLNFLAKENINTVVTHHAEFFYTANCGHSHSCTHFYDCAECTACPLPRSAAENTRKGFPHRSWVRMRRAFNAFRPGKLCFTAVSPWVAGRSALSPVVAGFPCKVVENGLDTSIFYRRTPSEAVLSRLNLQGRKMILHVTASFTDTANSLKGGDKIIELARLMPDSLFVIVASYNDVRETLPDNIIMWGRASSQQELAELYSAADLCVIASKRETFSMIVAESLSCGTPVAGFKAGGPESIAISDYSRFVEYGDIHALKNAAYSLMSIPYNRNEISDRAIVCFDSKVMADKYIKVYQSMLS